MVKPARLFDAEAELALLGCLLVAPGRWPEVEHLREEAFSVTAHAAIWRAMEALQGAGRPPDVIALRSALQDDPGAPPEALQALAQAEEEALSVAGLGGYVAVVENKARRRAWLEAGQRVMELATEEALPPAELRAALEGEVMRVLQVTADRRPATSLTQAVADALRELHEESQGKEPGVPWGLPKLDEVTRGLHRGEVTILAGKTGQGKSALAWQVAEHAASIGIGVVGFSLEMGAAQIARRRIAAALRHNAQRLRDVLVTRGAEILEYGERTTRMADLGLFDEGEQNLADIRSRARAWKVKHPELGLVVVDYLQLVEPPHGQRYASREREVATVSRGFKALAKELHVAVLALSQMNREADKEQRKPRLSDLRESGAVEHDAASIVFLHETDPTAPPVSAVPFELCVRKGRHGPGSADVEVLFHKPWMGFEEWSAPPKPPPEPKQPRGRKAKPAQQNLLDVAQRAAGEGAAREPGEDG